MLIRFYDSVANWAGEDFGDANILYVRYADEITPRRAKNL